MTPFKPISDNLFLSKNDPEDYRLGDFIKPALISELSKADSYCILGYPDDEGIKLNNGRLGAAVAPTTIRQYLYKMTPPVLSGPELFDAGDLNLNVDLPTRHQFAQTGIQALHARRIRTISLGGGHDYGYPDASAFLNANLNANLSQKSRPLVINFDAHLDVRPDKNGFNSGTPFFRLLNEFSGRFDFAEVGIQPQCNSLAHREWALAKQASIFTLNELNNNGGLKNLFQHPLFSQLTKATPVFISFDIDCLTSTEAPGCSQSWVTGLKTEDCLQFMAKLSKVCDLRGLGIYEVSPPLDLHNQTSKTAALLAYNFIYQGLL